MPKGSQLEPKVREKGASGRPTGASGKPKGAKSKAKGGQNASNGVKGELRVGKHEMLTENGYQKWRF